MAKVTVGQLDEMGQRLLDGRIGLNEMCEILHWPASMPDTLLGAFCRLVHLCNIGRIGRQEMQEILDSVMTPWWQMCVACRQHLVTSDFSEVNFPLEPVALDEKEWEVYEHHFGHTVTGEEAFRELEKLGYRPLNGSRRAMEFIAAHTDLQLNHPLVVTARWQAPNESWFVPIFCHHPGGKREVDLLCLTVNFGPRCGWLVLRKRAA